MIASKIYFPRAQAFPAPIEISDMVVTFGKKSRQRKMGYAQATVFEATHDE
jgi:hypothetical protein